ncbi:DUF2073 domain-containing protein [Candidatus Pacearchaeota archaeon]|nr:DUF2073 domain-containing protein [Candidatus Pacearchaeota archaeon]
MAKKIKGLTIEFIPYSEIRDLNSGERVKKLLSIVLTNRIIVLQGRLKPEEETRLIEDTMAMIDHVKHFKGIELAVIGADNGNNPVMRKFTSGIAKMLVGDTAAMTIIGPASIVKDIKKNPRKIELMLKK